MPLTDDPDTVVVAVVGDEALVVVIVGVETTVTATEENLMTKREVIKKTINLKQMKSQDVLMAIAVEDVGEGVVVEDGGLDADHEVKVLVMKSIHQMVKAARTKKEIVLKVNEEDQDVVVVKDVDLDDSDEDQDDPQHKALEMKEIAMVIVVKEIAVKEIAMVIVVMEIVMLIAVKEIGMLIAEMKIGMLIAAMEIVVVVIAVVEVVVVIVVMVIVAIIAPVVMEKKTIHVVDVQGALDTVPIVMTIVKVVKKVKKR